MYNLITDLNIIDTSAIAFCDIETEKLYVNPRVISIYQPDISDSVFIVDFDVVPKKDVVAKLEQMNTVWHNASYDLGTLNVVPKEINDTLYLARQAYPQWKNYSLDEVVANLGHNKLYDGLDKKAMQKSGFRLGIELTKEQLLYSATDVISLYEVWKDHKIQAARNIMSYKLDILAMKYAIQFQKNGIYVDTYAVQQELSKIDSQILEWKPKLNGVNCNSPKQCAIALNVSSTDKLTMTQLVNSGNELAEAIYVMRRLLKKKTFLESYNVDKVYTKYNVGGTITGRATTTGKDFTNGVNIQQVPRDLQYMLKSTNEDLVTIKADYSTVELRLAASIFKEPIMYKQFKAGLDLHTETAKMLVGLQKNIKWENLSKEEQKAYRQKAKAINFGFIYGMGINTFMEYALTSYGVKFTYEEAAEVRDEYFKRYPTIKQYHNYVWKAMNTGSFTYKTACGRAVCPNLGTEGINGAVQGSGADLLKLAVHYCVKKDARILDYMFATWYDAIWLTVPRHEKCYWEDLVKSCMEKAWWELCKTSLMYYKDIPIPIDVEEVA